MLHILHCHHVDHPKTAISSDPNIYTYYIRLRDIVIKITILNIYKKRIYYI